jgi:hypothetical protein
MSDVLCAIVNDCLLLEPELSCEWGPVVQYIPALNDYADMGCAYIVSRGEVTFGVGPTEAAAWADARRRLMGGEL